DPRTNQVVLDHRWGLAATLSTAIRSNLLRLWKLTGVCEYSDIRNDDLPMNASKIADRYRRFIQDKSKGSREAVLRLSLAANVELLGGEYAKQAVDVLQSTIAFTHVLDEAGLGNKAQIDERHRSEVAARMRAWLATNGQLLAWRESGGRFVDSR